MVTTVARGESHTAGKLNRVGHAAAVESGPYLQQYRGQCKGYLSDQGSVERNLPAAPFGDASEVKATLEAVKNRTPHLDSARRLGFLPFALQQVELLHIYFNALQHAIEGLEEWPWFLPILRDLTKLCGNRGLKDRLLNKCMQGRPRYERHLIHSFEGEHIDWRWEVLEDVLVQMLECFPIICECWNPDHFDSEADIARRVAEAMRHKVFCRARGPLV